MKGKEAWLRGWQLSSSSMREGSSVDVAVQWRRGNSHSAHHRVSPRVSVRFTDGRRICKITKIDSVTR